MKTHWRLALWALQFLWGLNGIWFADRFRLWKKSLNLYLTFLAFTDTERPFGQLQSAMLCAILTAVYDYDTDWTFGSLKGSNTLPLLQHIESEEARAIVIDLFSTEVRHELSEDGLERGSLALRFYWLVIDSNWMRGYTPDEIDAFGRLLQVTDDILDLEGDRVAGDTNCLLLEDRAQGFVAEAEGFLVSDFFGKLKSNSWVYRKLEDKVRGELRSIGTQEVTFKQLFATGRPSTGLYAFLLSLISFGFYEGTPWVVCVLTAFAFGGLTMSIMSFNDWVDRHNDRKKGKMFASEHPHELMQYWQRLSAVTALFLVPIVYWSVPLALFLAIVWVVGILYSYTRRWYLVNNVIVAVCSGSPALCGTVFHGEVRWVATCTFGIFTALIFINELYKDVEDRRTDRGYKATMPLRRGGSMLTVWNTIMFLYVPAALFAFHPNPWVKGLGMVAATLITFQAASAFLHPERIHRPMSAMRLTLKSLLIVLLVSSL